MGEHYEWASSSIDNDDYFELMMRNAWHISGGQGWAENTSDLRVLVRHSDGSEEVVELQNDMSLPLDPKQRYNEVLQRLAREGNNLDANYTRLHNLRKRATRDQSAKADKFGVSRL